MALIQCNQFSKSLNRMTRVNVILPLTRDPRIPISDLPVLYLLHGMSDDHTMWIRRTRVETAALKAGLAVVMPDGELSCYENMVHGARYRDYIAEELPAFIRDTFPVTRDRENTFIAGCSMGGCGALKTAFAYPEQYSVVGCFSAGHLEYRPDHPVNSAMLARAFADQLPEADARIEHDLDALCEKGPNMRILSYFGDHDILRESALYTQKRVTDHASPYIEYESFELSGGHDWDLWDECIRDFIPRLHLPKPKYRLF